MTEDVVSKIMNAIEIGASHELAAAHAGISYATFQNWLRQGRDVRMKEDADLPLSPTETGYLNFLRQLEASGAKAGMSWQEVVDRAARTDPIYAMTMLGKRFSGYRDSSSVNLNFSIDLSKHNLTEFQLNYIASGQMTNDQAQRIADGENPASVIPTSGAGPAGITEAAKPK